MCLGFHCGLFLLAFLFSLTFTNSLTRTKF
jgi:hypothetical protein